LGHFLKKRKEFLSSIGKDSTPKSVEGGGQVKLLELLSNTGTRQGQAISPQEGLGFNNFGPNLSASTARDTATIRQMMACSVHLGHATSRWHPKMAPFIFGERAGIHIINLESSLIALRQACNVVTDIASKSGTIVFVGTGDSIQRLTYECAQDCHQHYVNIRWIGGSITNKNQVLRNDKLAADLLIILDPINNKKAVLEAQMGNIPTIAICDTNFDPSLVTYPIPGNDDAFSSVELIARTLSLAASEGRQVRTKPLKSADIVDSATVFMDKIFGSRRNETVHSHL
jgi:small subunit ribosomal protein S2